MAGTKKIERIQRATDKLLQLVNVNDLSEPPVPIEQIAYLRGVQLRRVPFSASIVPKQEGELSGLLLWEHGHIIIGVNELHSKTRQRFAIAHQLGHLELHYRDGMHIDRSFPVPLREDVQGVGKPGPYHARPKVQSVDPVEMEANSFASELLLPVTLLERDLRGHILDYEDDILLRQLADRYQVSLQVMIFRLTSMGLINL